MLQNKHNGKNNYMLIKVSRKKISILASFKTAASGFKQQNLNLQKSHLQIQPQRRCRYNLCQ